MLWVHRAIMLPKVLQRLAQVGFLSSTRGPNGGFVLRKKPADINLLQIYEAIEGKLQWLSALWKAGMSV
jgi:DNA-binding IscR family transcriptional regulator